MRKKLLLKSILAMILIIPMAFVFVACGKDKDEDGFNDEWSYSATEHWHASIDQDSDDVKDKAEHTKSDWIVDSLPTCEEDGSKHKECTVCHYVIETEDIDALGHDYETSESSYVWIENFSKYHASRPCARNSNHAMITETVDVSTTAPTEGGYVLKTITQEKTCVNDEIATFTISTDCFKNAYFTENNGSIIEGVVTSRATGHSNTWMRNAEQHWEHCSVCETDTTKENHNFVNFVCECGLEQGVKIGNVGYMSLESAISHANNGDTITLLKDLVLNETIEFSKVGTTVTLDLNTHSITTSTQTVTSATSVAFNVNGGKLVVDNGTINVPGDAFNVVGYNSDQTLVVETTLELGASLNVICSNSATYSTSIIPTDLGNCVHIIGKGANLITSANLKTYANFAVIQGNGTSVKQSNSVTINGGLIEHASDVAIYLPNTVTINITGGTIKGATALYVKAGSLTITGGTFVGTGDTVAYAYWGNGCHATGDAVVIDACGYPGDAINVNITGGNYTVTDSNAHKIAYYKYNGNSAESFACTVAGVTYHEAEISE